VGRIFTVLGCDGETTSKAMRTQVRRPAPAAAPTSRGPAACGPGRGAHAPRLYGLPNVPL
jgi:hypothetical protein